MPENADKSNSDNTEEHNNEPMEFENAFAKLESLVQRMESGEQTLQESVDDFQNGMQLIKTLQHKLDDAEQKVELLIQNSAGDIESKSFDSEN